MLSSLIETTEDECGSQKVVEEQHGAEKGNYKENRKQFKEDVGTDKAE